MPDVMTKKQRSYNMSRIRGKNTKPEELVRKYLFAQGFRYRKNDKCYPGKPDIVLPKYHTIVLIHGCFWHQHPGCKAARIPETNQKFWADKFEKNVRRDKAVKKQLEDMGWRVIVVWECELSTKEKRETRLSTLAEEIREYNLF